MSTTPNQEKNLDYKLNELKCEIDKLQDSISYIDRETNSDSKIGCLYNINNNSQSTRLHYNGEIENRKLRNDDSPDVIKISQNSDSVTFLYEDCEDILKDPDSVEQKTIVESTLAHYVVAVRKGFRAIVELKFTEDNEHEKERIMKLIVNNSNIEDIPDDITFSISGAIPDEMNVSDRELDEEILDEEIRSFHNETTYEEMGDSLTVSVKLAPLKLNSYFSPIFDKLSELITVLKTESDDSILRSFCEILFELITDKVSECASLIVRGEDYTSHTKFLRDLLKSYFLDMKKLKELVVMFEIAQTSEVENLQQMFNDTSESPPSNGLSFQLCLMISANSSLKRIEQILRDNFEDNKLRLQTVKSLSEEFAQPLSMEKKSLVADSESMRHQLEELTATLKLQSVKISHVIQRGGPQHQNSSVELKIFKNGSYLDPQPPLLDRPVILSAECTEGNTIKLTWKLSASAKSAVTGHRLTYYNIMLQQGRKEGRKIQENIDGWSQLSVEVESIVLNKDIKEIGVYICEVQPLYGDLYGLASEPSEPVLTKECLKQTEDASASLKSLLNNYREFSAFDTSEKSKYNAQQITLENCDVGWLYNFEENKPESLNVMGRFVSKSFPLDTNSKLTIRDDIKTANEAIIKFTYKSYSETLKNDSDQFFLTTIVDTTSTHYIVSQVKGYEIIVRFRKSFSFFSAFKEGAKNKQQLEQIVKMLKEGKTLSEEIQKNIFLSVRGKIPRDWHINDRNLTLEEFSKLRKFTSEEFYVGIDSKPFTLSVNLLPLNLVYYFSPFYERLERLKQMLRYNYDWPQWKHLVDFLCEKTLQKITKTAASIKKYENCSKEIIFLRQLLNSDIIDPNQTEKLFKWFTELQQENAKSFVHKSHSSNVTAKVVVKISLKKLTQNLTKQFAEWFSSNSHIDNISKICSSAFSKEIFMCAELASSIESQLTEIIRDNHRGFSIVRQMTVDQDIYESTCEYNFERNGNVIYPKPPVFDSPQRLTATKGNSQSVELSWNMDEKSENLATLFIVEWKKRGGNYRETDVKYVNAKNAVIPNLEGNTNYKFRVRAMYPANYSDITGMSTEVEYNTPRRDFSPDDNRSRPQETVNLPGMRNLWGTAGSYSTKLIVPCEKGDISDKRQKFNSSPRATTRYCQFLEGECPRSHGECNTCRETFHFPHNDKTKLIELPSNWKEMENLLSVKFDTRSKLTQSCYEIKQTANMVINKLKTLQINSNFTLLADTESGRLIMRTAESDIDRMVIGIKSDVMTNINRLQERYFSHVDNVQDYSLRTAVSLLLKKNIDLSNCNIGIISKAKEISETYKRDVKSCKDEIDDLLVISYKCTADEYIANLSIEFEVIFHKVPKFFDRYEGMGTSTNSLNMKSMLLRETIDELQEKCIKSVDKLSSSINKDVELDQRLIEAVKNEDELRMATENWKFNSNCDNCKTDRSNGRNWPYYCHMCYAHFNGTIEVCDLCKPCRRHFT